MAPEGSLPDIDAAFRLHRGDLFNYFRRSGLPRPAAEDLTQSVFVALLEGRSRFDAGRGSVRVFLFGIARNLRLQWQQRVRPRLAEAIAGSAVAVRNASAEDFLAIREAVLALPDVQREAVLLREFHGLEYAEIARIQEVAIGTVRSRLFQARDAMRRRLRGEPSRDKENR